MKLFLAAWLIALTLQAESTLRLKVTADEAAAARETPPKRRAQGRSHRIIELGRPPPEVLNELRERGVELLRYVPDTGFLVSAEDGLTIDSALRDAPMRAAEKLSALLAESEEAGLFVVEFHPDVSDGDARSIVMECSLEIQEHPDLAPGHLLVKGAPAAVAALAEWDEVAYIFPASADLAEGLPVQACAGALTDLGAIGQYVSRVGEGWDGPGKNAAKLGYAFTQLTAKLPADAVRTTLLKALAEWSRVVQIRFDPVSDPAARATLNFLFASGAHGDPYPFDGPGRVLAHTFYPAPPNPEPLAGDVHFDADERWNSPESVDLYSVAFHEIGHALGLGHSDKPGAVMYPYYRKLDKLTAEDVQAIQEMYAAVVPDNPAATPQPPPSPAPQPPPSPAPQPPPQPAPPPAARDTVSPTIRITSPALTNVFTSAPSIVLKGTAADNIGVTEVSWATSFGASGRATGTTSWTTSSIALAYGSTMIVVRAWDAARNSSWRSVSVTRY